MKNYMRELIDKYDINSSDLVRAKARLKEIKKNSFITELTFYIDHEPKPAKRPRSGKYSFYVPDAAKNKKEIRELIKEQVPENHGMIYTDMSVDIKCYMPMLSNFSKIDKFLAEKGIIRPITKPDVDNFEKTYFDALNGYIWEDDGQVVDGRTRKYYSVHPRVEVTIRYRNIFLSALLEGYHRKKMQGEGERELLKEQKALAKKEKARLKREEAKKEKAKAKKGVKKNGK